MPHDGDGGAAVAGARCEGRPAEAGPEAQRPPAAGGGAPAPGKALEELLQQRARSAIESAKQRNVMRENQRMAGEFVHRLLRRVVLKLNWVEEERRERERLRKKAFAWDR